MDKKQFKKIMDKLDHLDHNLCEMMDSVDGISGNIECVQKNLKTIIGRLFSNPISKLFANITGKRKKCSMRHKSI